MESVATPLFSGIAEIVVPETGAMNDTQWREFYSIIDAALAKRPAKMRRQLKLFLKILNLTSLLRYRKQLHYTTPQQRLALLSSIENSKLLLFRRGLWGVRTLVYMGFYANTETAAALGYRAAPRGWELRR